MDALRRGVAALLAKINAPDETWCCGHKEYAPRRKVDPSFDMDGFRVGVAAILKGQAPAPSLIPKVDAANRPTLRRGNPNNPEDFVKTLQTRIGATPDGGFGPDTEAKLRAFQRLAGLVPDGIAGPATWAKLFP